MKRNIATLVGSLVLAAGFGLGDPSSADEVPARPAVAAADRPAIATMMIANEVRELLLGAGCVEPFEQDNDQNHSRGWSMKATCNGAASRITIEENRRLTIMAVP